MEASRLAYQQIPMFKIKINRNARIKICTSVGIRKLKSRNDQLTNLFIS